MAIQYVGPMVGLARSMIRSRVCGLLQVVLAFVVGRGAVAFERERRATLLAVSTTLRPGTEICDTRADGSTLRVTSLPRDVVAANR